VSCVRLILPKGAATADFEAFHVDVEPHSWDGPVVMAGFATGSRWSPPEHEDAPFPLEQSLVVRVAKCRGSVEQAPPFRAPMYQVNAPSLPGMSGGPLLALRYPRGRKQIISPYPSIHATAVGVISRDCLSAHHLVDGSDTGETWVAPMEDASLLRLGWGDDIQKYFGDVVRAGRIKHHRQRALTAEVIELGEHRLGVRFGLPHE
jgi:hypothetical protein